MLGSPLNDHLYSLIHVVEQPNGASAHIRENNKKNLLNCLLYSNEWNQMITELNNLGFKPLLNILLYVNNMYSGETTQKAFLIIQ